MTRHAAVVAIAVALVACGDRPAPPAARPPVAASADPNDPAEPGIPDLARLARYVFRTMQLQDAACPLENPFRDMLHVAFMIEVKSGRMARVALSEAALQTPDGRRALSPAERPKELAAYLACLEPHLRAVVMRPAPSDGLYEPAYSFGGQSRGKPAP